MKYEVIRVQELGNEVLPCYEATVRQFPNILEMFFGARKEEFKCVSDLGLDWYRLPKFEKIEFNSPLDKLLLEIPQSKRTKSMQKLFEGIREFRVRAIADESRSMN